MKPKIGIRQRLILNFSGQNHSHSADSTAVWIKIFLSQDPTERAATKSLENGLAEQNTKTLGSGKEALQNLFCPEKFKMSLLTLGRNFRCFLSVVFRPRMSRCSQRNPSSLLQKVSI
ncbi:MAG: hypothetical protein HY266_07400 [Deltaproteobacteria bacterium]|nr:hypothetical protein [Deltaproteobacteria bacterium]